MCAKFQMISIHYRQLPNHQDTKDEAPASYTVEI